MIAAGPVAPPSWVLWLAAPLVVTFAAAIWVWLHGWRMRRAARPLRTEAAVRAHNDYLDALVRPARSRDLPVARPSAPQTGDQDG